MKYIQSSLWEKVEKSKTKIAKRVYNKLNEDILQVVEDDGIFWIEKVCSDITIPNFVYNYVIKFYKKQGLKYLYD
jgi:hypothetical protein